MLEYTTIHCRLAYARLDEELNERAKVGFVIERIVTNETTDAMTIFMVRDLTPSPVTGPTVRLDTDIQPHPYRGSITPEGERCRDCGQPPAHVSHPLDLRGLTYYPEDPHTYERGPNDANCLRCMQPREASVHT